MGHPIKSANTKKPPFKLKVKACIVIFYLQNQLFLELIKFRVYS